VLTGVVPSVVPADLYRRLTADLQRNAVDVVVDTSGDRLVAAVRGGASLVKLSDEELVRDGYAVGTTDNELWDGVGALRAQGAKEVVISRSGKPALAYVGGQALEAAYPEVEVLEARGAGDAMTGGLAVGRASGLPPEDALRLAVAAATLSVTRRGLATGRRDDIEHLATQVSVRADPTGSR
jgi:1-phosphofructokinase